MSDSAIHKRYNDLKRKGIAIMDIASDTVPRRFLDVLLKQNHTTFNYFFNEFVIERNKEILYNNLFMDMCGNDDSKYREIYLDLLSDAKDQRTKKAIIKEMSLLEHTHKKGMPYLEFLGISSRRRLLSKDNNSTPIRIFLHVSDKLDIRTGSSLYDIPWWQYVGELIADGMLKIFIKGCTTREEKSLLNGMIDKEVDNDIIDDALDTLYERIIHEYKAVLRSASSQQTNLRTDFEMGAMRRIVENKHKDINYLESVFTDPSFRSDIIRIPKLKLDRISIIDDDDDENIVNQNLLEIDIQKIINDNIERMMGKKIGIQSAVSDPMTREVLENFRDIIFKRDVTKHTRIADTWKQLRTIVYAQIETLALINDKDPHNIDIEYITSEICKNIYGELVKNDILDQDADELLDLDRELLLKIRYAIDDATMDGGITKSQLRVKIGRNHSRYMKAITEILGYLIETGKYVFTNGRYIAVTGNAHTTRMVPQQKRGRPRNDDDNDEPVQHVEGKLSDYLPKFNKK